MTTDHNIVAALDDLQVCSVRQDLARRASDHLAHEQDRIIAKAIAKQFGDDVALESLRGRLTMVSYAGSENRTLLLDDKPLIEFFPLRTSEEHRNGSHFLNLSLPYRLFDWELEQIGRAHV